MSVSGILVLGRPSTGKSTSLRNLNPKTTTMFTPNRKPLPWRGSSTQYIEGENRFVTSSLVVLKTLLEKITKERPETKTVVIEDLSHFFTERTLSSAFVNAADKWGRWEIYGADIYAIIKQATEDLKDLEAVIVLHHTKIDDKGIETFASSGNLVDREVKPPSHFTTIFHSVVLEGEKDRDYVFQTNFAEHREAKTPMGMFEDLYIPNDITKAIEIIKEYENSKEPEVLAVPEAIKE